MELNNNYYPIKYVKELVENFSPVKTSAVSKRNFLAMQSRFVLSENDLNKWRGLFGAHSARVPFTIPVKAGSLALMKYVNSHQLPFKNLFHVKSQFTVHAGGHAIEAEEYRTLFRCSHDLDTKKRRAIVRLHSETSTYSGRPLMTLIGWFVIRNLSAKNMKNLAASNAAEVEYKEFDGLSKKVAGLSKTDSDLTCFQIRVPNTLGLSYGLLSGDMNPVHTTRLGAYLIGKTKPFIQGFCTLNLVVSELVKKFSLELNDLEMTYCNPVFVGNDIDLLVKGSQFEIWDKKERLLAFGAFS